MQHVLQLSGERVAAADACAGQQAVGHSGVVRMGSPAIVLTVLVTGVLRLPSALQRHDQRMQCRAGRREADPLRRGMIQERLQVGLACWWLQLGRQGIGFGSYRAAGRA